MKFVPYPAIEKHGVIGDRRSCAVVAADGTVSWLCLPRFDDKPVFGALLDAERGGYWRFGPASPALGLQRYVAASCSLTTTWTTPEGELELVDSMLNPDMDGPRALLRRLRCVRGRAQCAHDIDPKDDFAPLPPARASDGALVFDLPRARLHLRLIGVAPAGVENTAVRFLLEEGSEAWSILALDGDQILDAQQAAAAMLAADEYWQRVGHVFYTGPRRERVARSNLLIHLLTHGPSGAVVAAPTASVPERIGGDWNADYRFTWIRDASLSLAVLAVLGNTASATQYMDFLAGLQAPPEAPLQVLYRVDGGQDAPQSERGELAGYRGSRPVRFGNHAAGQRQLDSFGFLCDCAFMYLEEGAPWKEEYWPLVERAAEHVLATWQRPDNSLWELAEVRHYVSSKVMGWVALERSVRIARVLGREGVIERWTEGMRQLHEEVMQRGWSERLRCFRQHYDAETLDASALLISVMEFLPPDHPRVLQTIERIESDLSIDGFVYRFDPAGTVGNSPAPLAEFESAFLPCTFWLATAHARAGHPERAERILERAEAVAQHGWFAEGVDPRDGTFRGNFPLLFSQVEYVRAVMETAKAKPLQMAEMLPGMAAKKVKQLIGKGR